MDNDFLNRDDTMQQEEVTARAKLKFLVSDDLTVDVSFLHLDIDNGYDAFTLENTRTTFTDNPGRDKQKSDSIAVKADWQMSDAVIVQAEATYQDTDIVYSFDADWGYEGRFDPSLSPYIGFSRFDRERKNASFDIRLLSDEAGRIFNGSTDWTIGFYHFSQDEYFDQNADFGIFGGTFRDGDYDTENTAVYGQLDTKLTDKLTLITGLRFEKFDADYSDSGDINIDADEDLYGGKIGLNFKANDTNFIYSSFSRGYRSGGVNNDGNLDNSLREFDTEFNYTFEAGIKSSWLSGSLITDFAIFHTDRRDAQLINSVEVSPGKFTSFTDNAGTATHKGIEASLNWLVNNNLRILGSLGLLDAEFDDYETNTSNLSGRQVAHAPDYTFNLGAELYPTHQWTLRANIEGKDEFFFSDSNDIKSRSYAIVNASAEYSIKNWRISVWARNLFDKEYTTRGLFLRNDPSRGYAQTRYTQFAEPRVAGVTVKYEY
jgi:outer membrane receptor protein involved in Fe transport